jgi:hypothetical protein
VRSFLLLAFLVLAGCKKEKFHLFFIPGYLRGDGWVKQVGRMGKEERRAAVAVDEEAGSRLASLMLAAAGRVCVCALCECVTLSHKACGIRSSRGPQQR